MSFPKDDDKKGSVESLSDRSKAHKKSGDADAKKDDAVEKSGGEKLPDLGGGHLTGGEATDGEGNVDSTQSAKPVPRDALKVDIGALGGAADASGNAAQPGHDNAKMAEDEESEDVDGEVEEDSDEEDE